MNVCLPYWRLVECDLIDVIGHPHFGVKCLFDGYGECVGTQFNNPSCSAARRIILDWSFAVTPEWLMVSEDGKFLASEVMSEVADWRDNCPKFPVVGWPFALSRCQLLAVVGNYSIFSIFHLGEDCSHGVLGGVLAKKNLLPKSG